MITIRQATTLSAKEIFDYLLVHVPTHLDTLPDVEELDADTDIARSTAWAILHREGKARITVRVYENDEVVAEYPLGAQVKGNQVTQYCEKVRR